LQTATAEEPKSFLKKLPFPQLVFSNFALLFAFAAEMPAIFPERMHGLAGNCA